MPYLQKYGFDGIHFDWNYPRCWQSDCRKGPESDRPNFTKLIKEISAEFQKQGLILGVGISGYKEILSKSYELDELSNAADFLTVMTYGMSIIYYYASICLKEIIANYNETGANGDSLPFFWSQHLFAHTHKFVSDILCVCN